MSVGEPFDVNASFPADPKHRPAIEALVAQAAAQAGCAPDVAQDFADQVGTAFCDRAGVASPGASVGVRLERASDKIEVAVSCGETVRLSQPLAITR